jgi:DNA-binding PadR family transcriptional regulator
VGKNDRKDGDGHPYMTKDMSHIILKLLVLKRMQGRNVYSYALIKEFSGTHISHFIKAHGGSMKNDIYNTVKALEKSGYISPKAMIEDGRLKKYYRLTSSGSKALQESKLLFKRNMKELMEIIK